MMTDWLHVSLKWAEQNRFLVLGFIVALILPLGMMGCDPKVTSPITGKPVSLKEFNREAVTYEQDLAVRITALDQELEAWIIQEEMVEDEFKEKYQLREGFFKLVGSAGTAIATGGLSAINPGEVIAGILQLGFGLGGIGLIGDNRRKNRLLAGRGAPHKNGTKSSEIKT